MTTFEHFLRGIKYKYPICCIIHFCWDDFLDDNRPINEYRNCVECPSEHVHCSLCHLMIKLKGIIYDKRTN